MIIHAFVSSRLDYCNSLFTCLSNTSLNRLPTKVVQNTVAKFLTRSLTRSHVIPILWSFHQILIKSRIQFEILVFTYRALHGQAPTYIKELLMPFNTSMTLRSSDPGLLLVARTRAKIMETVLLRVQHLNFGNVNLLNLEPCAIKTQLRANLFRPVVFWSVYVSFMELLAFVVF